VETTLQVARVIAEVKLAHAPKQQLMAIWQAKMARLFSLQPMAELRDPLLECSLNCRFLCGQRSAGYQMPHGLCSRIHQKDGFSRSTMRDQFPSLFLGKIAVQ
jgi:hypothetical protein